MHVQHGSKLDMLSLQMVLDEGMLVLRATPAAHARPGPRSGPGGLGMHQMLLQPSAVCLQRGNPTS